MLKSGRVMFHLLFLAALIPSIALGAGPFAVQADPCCAVDEVSAVSVLDGTCGCGDTEACCSVERQDGRDPEPRPSAPPASERSTLLPALLAAVADAPFAIDSAHPELSAPPVRSIAGALSAPSHCPLHIRLSVLRR